MKSLSGEGGDSQSITSHRQWCVAFEHSGPISFLSVFAGYVCLPGAVQSFDRVEFRPRVICKRRVQSGCVCACVQVCACTACLRELRVRLLVRYLRVRRVVRRQSPVACSAYG